MSSAEIDLSEIHPRDWPADAISLAKRVMENPRLARKIKEHMFPRNELLHQMEILQSLEAELGELADGWRRGQY